MEAPRIPKLFGIRTKQPNQFHYEPRYYDEKREKREKRTAQIKRELELEGKISAKTRRERSEDFRSELRENWGVSHRKKEGAAFNTRIIVLITAMLGLAYYFLK